jgi:hypothetical protein
MVAAAFWTFWRAVIPTLAYLVSPARWSRSRSCSPLRSILSAPLPTRAMGSGPVSTCSRSRSDRRSRGVSCYCAVTVAQFVVLFADRTC